MRIRSKMEAALLAGAVGALAFVSSPAQAAAVCPQGQVCFYQNYDLTGSMYKFNKGESEFVYKTFYNHSSVNDQVSSIANKTGHDVVVATDINFGGEHWIIPNGTTVYRLPDSLNDRLSSAMVDK